MPKCVLEIGTFTCQLRKQHELYFENMELDTVLAKLFQWFSHFLATGGSIKVGILMTEILKWSQVKPYFLPLHKKT